MIIRSSAIVGALGILAGVLVAEANATTLTETGSFSDVVSVADGASAIDQITLAPFDPVLGTLTNTSVTVTTNGTFNGFADVPCLFPGGLHSIVPLLTPPRASSRSHPVALPRTNIPSLGVGREDSHRCAKRSRSQSEGGWAGSAKDFL